MGSSLQAKKTVDRSSIIEVNDIKPFKKLQRTHTNLLVLFAQSGEFYNFLPNRMHCLKEFRESV